MTDKTPRRRLVAIIWVVLLCAVAAPFLVQMAKASAIENDIRQMQARLAKADPAAREETDLEKRIRELSSLLENAKKRFYLEGEIEQAEFGLAVKQALSERGLTTETYKITTAGGKPQLDYSVSGNLSGFLDFLRSVSLARRYNHVNYLSLNATEGYGDVKANFRIGYASLSSNPGEKNARPFTSDDLAAQAEDLSGADLLKVPAVARLFIWKIMAKPPGPVSPQPEIPEATIAELEKPEPELPKLELPVPEPPAPEPPEIVESTPQETIKLTTSAPSISREAVKVDWLSYIGTIVQAQKQYYIFKDARTNRILRLPRGVNGGEGWKYLQGSDAIHYLEKDGVTYKVSN